MIRTFDELCRAIADRLNECEDEDQIMADAELMRLADLASAYMDAERNPPEGIIGVGAITYAEQIMQGMQQ